MGSKEAFLESDLAPFLAVSIYGVIYSVLISKFGQTPGKKAYELKVVDAKSEKNLSFIRAFYRFIMLLVVLYRKDKKSLHDLVCGTMVIVHKNKTIPTI